MFLGVEVGEITWAVLLNGAVGVVGAAGAVCLGFWLSRAAKRRDDLALAVEELRSMTTLLIVIWRTKNDKGESKGYSSEELLRFHELARLSGRVMACTSWWDHRLRAEIRMRMLPIAEAVWDRNVEPPSNLAVLLTTWLNKRWRFRLRLATVPQPPSGLTPKAKDTRAQVG
ncbi:hypothetical protein G1H11_14235 [Phytoactinopolyspora alkaliphila]|uniref:Uncharacterized protein n=1 Tax=Phytoactinopolyspora alkaliphila TaxID=1783498 RepID=A0A6N9YNE3_9ACTN|nr:hypothetical protein [Phytoactinopolyspora alkaliphila]NED96465.1 hypothetical protein [Phytoactinopolyspora alkaliphila]